METRKTTSPSRGSKSLLCSRHVPFFPKSGPAFDASKIRPRVNTGNSHVRDNADGATATSSPAARRRTYSEGTQDKPVIKLVRPATSNGRPHVSPLVISMSYVSPTSSPDEANSPTGYDTILISPKKDKNDKIVFKYETPEKICDENRQRACSLGSKEGLKKLSKNSPRTSNADDTKTSSATNISPRALSNAGQESPRKSGIKAPSSTATVEQRAATTTDDAGATGRQDVATRRVSRIPIRRPSSANNTPIKVSRDQSSSLNSNKAATLPREGSDFGSDSRPRAHSLESKVNLRSSRLSVIKSKHISNETEANNQSPNSRSQTNTQSSAKSDTLDKGASSPTPHTSSPLHTPQEHATVVTTTTTMAQRSTSATMQGVESQNEGQPCPHADHCSTALSDHQEEDEEDDDDEAPLQPPIPLSFPSHNPTSAKGTEHSRESQSIGHKQDATPTNRWDATPNRRATPIRRATHHQVALQELLEEQTTESSTSSAEPSLADPVPTTTNKYITSSPTNRRGVPNIVILDVDGAVVEIIRPSWGKLPSWDSIDRTLECNKTTNM
ncbi:hypothetical protein EMCRGX_G006161 [Ephydatia muelleri]